MKAVCIFYLLLLGILFFSCNKSIDDERFPFVELYHCANANINDNTVNICFDSLITDSRCPINAMCIWQGEATVKLSLSVNGQQHSFKLSTLDMLPQFRNDTIVFGYKVKLLSVSPYPGDNSPAPTRAELSITQ